ncbi:MAG: hypothetical protein PVI30_15625 [Myxococcales bacterium]|jgi:hypothetical protein
MNGRWSLLAWALVCATAARAPAAAQQAPTTPTTGSETDSEPESEPSVGHAASEVDVGLVAALGLHTGAAAGVRLAHGDFGLEVVGGYQPLLAFSDDGSREMDVDLGSSAQLGAELTFMPWRPKKSSAIGLKGGYRYNSVLEHGFAAALAFMVDLGESVALQVCAGGSFFPGQEQTLRDELNVPEENDLAYASNAQFFEFGFELIWLP